jgi:prenyltransferase beta subunit
VKRLVLCLLLLDASCPRLFGQTADEKRATSRFVQSLELSQGGFAPDRQHQGCPRLSATVASIRALRHFGSTGGQATGGAERFVRSCFDPTTGGFADLPGGKPTTITTAFGLMALAELDVKDASLRQAARRFLESNARSFEEIRMAAAAFEAIGARPSWADDWLQVMQGLRTDRGTYGGPDCELRTSAGAIASILRLGGSFERKDPAIPLLVRGQKPDGGYGRQKAETGDLDTTYRVVRALRMLGIEPALPDKCRAFVVRCRNSDGGYGMSPGAPSGAAPTYFAGAVLHWLDELHSSRRRP